MKIITDAVQNEKNLHHAIINIDWSIVLVLLEKYLKLKYGDELH